MKRRIYSIAQVIELTGLSRTTLWRLEKAGDFPQRIQISKRRVGWLGHEVNKWTETRRRVA
jgi:predicted DNA-binding transcriptional regulator AlpA